MKDSPWNSYVAGFRDSITHWIPPGLKVLEAPGILGYFGSADQPAGRIVISDDRAVEQLQSAGDPFVNVASVHPSARQCLAYLSRLEGYQADGGTAMVAEALEDLPAPVLEPRLTLHRATLEPREGEISLTQAAAAFFRFDPPTERGKPDPDAFASYLHSIPHSSILVAIDGKGAISATAGSAVFGSFARVFFVSTHPDQRGRGIGTAITAAALQDARERGATRACLEASDSGRAIYQRLGFVDASPITLFARL